MSTNLMTAKEAKDLTYVNMIKNIQEDIRRAIEHNKFQIDIKLTNAPILPRTVLEVLQMQGYQVTRSEKPSRNPEENPYIIKWN